MHVVRRLLVLACAAAVAFSLRCGSDEGPGPPPTRLTISPRDITVSVSSRQEFTAEADGRPAVPSWYVDGIRGGHPDKGMIDVNGLYVAPADIPSGGYVTVTARATFETVLKDSVRVTISKPAGTPCVTVLPDTIPVVPFGIVEFHALVSDCATEAVTWSLSRLWGSALDLGDISEIGVYEAPAGGSNVFAVMVQATSVDCPAKRGIAKVVFYPTDWPDIQLESYTESNDSAGSAPIRAAQCGGAVGGWVVEGLDREGEWVSVPVYVASSGQYRALVRCQTDSLITIVARVAMEGCGTPVPEAEFVLTGGDGLG